MALARLGVPVAFVGAIGDDGYGRFVRDELRDEGIDYASRLLQAGVPCELHSFAGTFHGSSLVAGAAVEWIGR